MTSANTTLRGLLVYALVLPVALWVGVTMGSVDTRGVDVMNWGKVGLVIFALALPLLLRLHHALLFLSWNTTVMVFFLPGRPELWLLMAFISLMIALVQRTLLRDMLFIHAPSVLLPIVFLGVVTLVTAEVTDSFGLHAFGSQVIGGRSYLFIFGAIAGFIAMLSYRIPQHKALLFCGLFLLGPIVNGIGTLAPYVPPWMYPIFMVFPVTGADLGSLATTGLNEGPTRFYGLCLACQGVFLYVLARYGIKEMLGAKNVWRLMLLVGVVFLGTMGGFRSLFIFFVLMFLVVFYYEGLFRSRHAFAFVAALVLGGAVTIPLASKLPLSIQRSISFLPLDIDPVARVEADASTQWRIEMWKSVLPDIDPRRRTGYFWQGKGLGFSEAELQFSQARTLHGENETTQEMLLAGNYHNGPLSLLLPFGVWGAIGWLWFMVACMRALYLNFHYGDESLRRINTLLLGWFLVKCVMFLLIFGDFRAEFASFTGVVGFSLALNHGIRKPVRATRIAPPITLRMRPSLKPATVVGRG